MSSAFFEVNSRLCWPWRTACSGQNPEITCSNATLVPETFVALNSSIDEDYCGKDHIKLIHSGCFCPINTHFSQVLESPCLQLCLQLLHTLFPSIFLYCSFLDMWCLCRSLFRATPGLSASQCKRERTARRGAKQPMASKQKHLPETRKLQGQRVKYYELFNSRLIPKLKSNCTVCLT